MHHDLDDELNAAFTRSASPGERASLYDLVRETESRTNASKRRPRARRLTALLVVGALGLGGTATAFAAPVVWDWLNFTPDASTTVVLPSGMTCKLAYRISPFYTEDAEVAEATAFVTEHLRTLDLDSLPIEQTLADLQASGRVKEDDAPEEQMESALQAAVWNALAAAVEDEGLRPDSFGLEGNSLCE